MALFYLLFTDVGSYLETAKIKPVRFYALPGEAGTVMCSFPRGGEDKAPGKVKNEWEKLVVGYFSECLTGFTYQAASHMIAEDLVDEGMEIIKAIHDRYNPAKRNPYNEVEYGNHYTRAMSGYGAFVAASGFKYHGPKGEISFAPKINPDKFQSAFITAEGWGAFSQERKNNQQVNSLKLSYGKLLLGKMTVQLPDNTNLNSIVLELNGEDIKIQKAVEEGQLTIRFKEIVLGVGDLLEVTCELYKH